MSSLQSLPVPRLNQDTPPAATSPSTSNPPSPTTSPRWPLPSCGSTLARGFQWTHQPRSSCSHQGSSFSRLPTLHHIGPRTAGVCISWVRTHWHQWHKALSCSRCAVQNVTATQNQTRRRFCTSTSSLGVRNTPPAAWPSPGPRLSWTYCRGHRRRSTGTVTGRTSRSASTSWVGPTGSSIPRRWPSSTATGTARRPRGSQQVWGSLSAARLSRGAWGQWGSLPRRTEGTRLSMRHCLISYLRSVPVSEHTRPVSQYSIYNLPYSKLCYFCSRNATAI